MSQKFVKGRTNNHLTWVMVDATDFATPESAVSAATTIKIYGKVRGATGVNFVSSGTGSLTNDIVHVGASILGTYTIALVKADLSDASNAWYDQYTIALSATGCARQLLVVDGGIDESAILVGASAASDVYSAALIIQSRLSDLDSRLASDTSDILSAATAAASRALINQSRISDIASYLVVMSGVQSDLYSLVSDLESNFGSRVPKEVAARSQLSDLSSDMVSDLRSFIGVGVPLDASTMSDIRSAITAGPGGVVTASDISDIASAVWAAKYTVHSAASSFGSLFSDVYSRVVVIQSAASDAASAATQANSRVLLNQSRISDVYSLLSDFDSDFDSRIPKEPAARSQLSDLVSDVVSDLRSFVGAGVSLDASTMSDLRSAITAAEFDASDISDIGSRVVVVLASDLSDILSAATAGSSRALLNQSRISDVYSAIAAGVELGASSLSDLRSAITATELDASDLSDIASAVWARAGADPTAVIGVTANMGAKLDWLAMMSRNSLTQTATKQTAFADNGTTVVASAVVSDDATTAVRGEFG